MSFSGGKDREVAGAMDYNRYYYWLALRFIDGLGSIGYRKLLSAFRSPEKVFSASEGELEGVVGMKPDIIQQLKEKNFGGRVEQEIEMMRKHQVKLLPFLDADYPARLLTIHDPPPLLYVKGELREEDGVAVAIVGSRFASYYGRVVTQRISHDLAREGVTVVSGFARGIDTSAHRGALLAKGRTIAVLGCGIDVNYPMENNKMKEEIASQGALISEFPMGTPPSPLHFPIRNRIISGLSLGVVVVEASYRSGSLITARLALDQGREVFAVPGSIDSLRSRGTHRLIKEGAKLVEDAQDILVELLPQIRCRTHDGVVPQKEEETLSEEAGRVLGVLENGQLHIDGIIAATGLSSSQVSSTLLQLELRGLVRQLPGKMFVRR